MRDIIVTEFISIDGVIDSPGGESGYRHTGWTLDIEQDPTMYEYKLEETLATAAGLLGRETYEIFAAAWPERENEFADALNSMPKYVVSTTLADPAWNNTHVLADIDAVRQLRKGDGGPIVVAGSATLVRALLDADLVDEWHLMVFPVILGSGKRLFPDDAEQKTKLRLVESRTYANGVQLQVLRKAGR